jgi:hypothetical protein
MARPEFKYETPSPHPIIFDVFASSLQNDIQFFSAPKSRRPTNPGGIGWGIGLAEPTWFRENSNNSQVPCLF